MQLYVAGALFTPAERKGLEEIAALCEELGFKTYLPHRDGGTLRADRSNAAELFSRDLNALRTAAAVLAVLGGADVDSGTAWEIGYAFCAGKPIIGLCEDLRVRDAAMDLNPMLAGSVQVTRTREELRKALQALT